MPSECRLKRVGDSPQHDVTLDTGISDWRAKAVKVAKTTNDSAQDEIALRIFCWID